ncbi:MAG: crotonase/enoyl-CoA hydratase family protein [bacterium]|nr:crotonase/enoyl-CoA hydratase family protein [Gammaproteobacteria bacterium]HIL98354.1 crotonase/enoyl-CoA hydratase family protein [Pseudomonadales bacterium]
METDDIIYEEKDGIAIIAINRPEKKNTLTNEVVEGIANGIDAASRSPDVAAIVLRGVGDTFTAGYDLTNQGKWDTPYGAPPIDAREGAWDPVRDYQFMANNVRRFMTIWECPKPVLGEVKGWAIGGATDLVLCCDLLYMATDAHIGYAPSRIYGTPTTMMWVYRLGLEHAKQFLLTGRAIDAETAFRIGLVSQVVDSDKLSVIIEQEARRFKHIPANQLALNKLLINQAFENMGLRSSQMLGTFFDGVTRHTEEAYQWVEGFQEKGFRQVIRERDEPWQDYGEKPKQGEKPKKPDQNNTED